MHPSVSKASKDLLTSRFVAKSCVQWLGLGLECAQRVGALPKELTAAQKSERPCKRSGRRVDVVPDGLWWQERRQDHLTCDGHPSHALHQVGAFIFCVNCGCYGSERLAALALPCERSTTPSRRYLLRKLLDGRHPRSGEYLGAVTRVNRAERQDERQGRAVLSVSRRKRADSV